MIPSDEWLSAIHGNVIDLPFHIIVRAVQQMHN